ncbi:hypothetical protein SteCoe_2344 [Stentor coeruleus]|uniref:Uncharacterized protein n=1 Tax=Stentor coeruleus TaxID=5963 RepID=A0A1R2CZL6_9CILI|nr:hypothetical protein SteCoe_2344 [Stentor coeruleus]
MFLALFIFSSFSAQAFLLYQDKLSPVEIFWPKSWVFNNIEPSTNHANSKIILTVYCRVLIDLPSGAEATLIVPGRDTNFVNETNEYKVAGEDLEFTFGFYDLDKGTYGPISLVIRQKANGQILAAKAAFGQIAIIDPLPSPTEDLQVSFYSSSKVIMEPAVLKFSFNLSDTDRIEKYDYFILDLDPSFKYRNGKLTWDSEISDSKLFSDTKFEKIGSSIIIYKLLNETHNGITVSFTISGFTNPINLRTPNNYFWTLTIHRFGTPTNKKILIGKGPNESLNPGTFISPSWSFVNDYIDETQAYENLIIFTKLKFTLEHDIPIGGVIYITYEDVDISLYGYNSNNKQELASGSFIYSKSSEYSSELDCFVDNSINAHCVVNKYFIPRSSIVTVFNLVKFYNNANIIKIESKVYDDKEGIEMVIDTISGLDLSLATLIMITTENFAMGTGSLVYFVTNIYDPTGVYESGSFGTFGLVISLKDPIGFNKDDSVYVMFPVKKGSEPDLNKVTIEEYLYGYYTYNMNPYDSATFLGYIPIEAPSLEEDCISFKLSADYSVDNYVNIYIAAKDIYGIDKNFYLPYFPITNKDMHEIVVKVENLSSGRNFYISKPLNFVVNTHGTMSFEYFCLAYDIPGLPAKFSFTLPYSFSHPDYTIQIAFIISDGADIDLGCGLESGMEYPSIGDHNVIYEFDGSNVSLYMKLNSEDQNTVNFIIPFLYRAHINMHVKISTVSSTEKRIIAETYFENYYNYNGLTYGGYYDYRTNENVEFSLYESLSYNDGSENQHNIIFTLGKGFKFTNNLALIDGNQVTFDIMSSDNLMFNYAVGYIESIVLYDYMQIEFIFNIKTSWFAYGSYSAYLAYATNNDYFTNSGCNNPKYYYINLEASKLKYYDYSPKYSKGYTNSNPFIDISISFTFEKTIYAGSKIKVIFEAGYFDIKNSKWSISIGEFSLNTDSCVSSSSCTSDKLTNDVTNSLIVITLHDVLLPVILEDGNRIHGFYSVNVYFTDTNNNDYLMQEWNQNNNDWNGENETYFFKSLIQTGVSQIENIWVFPSTKGATSVYFGISFILPYDLPLGTIITIYGENFDYDSLAKDNTWCNYRFDSVVINNYNQLEIVTGVNIKAGETIEIIKDFAFSLSEYNDKSVSFFIKAKYESVLIIDDIQFTSGRSFFINDVPNIKTKIFKIIPNISNQGVKNYYTFTFMLDSNTDPLWYYCFDASHNYDANVGDTFTLQGIDNVLFLYAKSSLSVNLYCTVNHWIICCHGFNDIIVSYTEIDISIYITNPAKFYASFNMYIVDENLKSVVINTYEFRVYFTDIPQNSVDIFHASFEYTSEATSNVIVEAYFDTLFEENSLILVEFPRPFNLEVNNPKEIICSVHYCEDDNNFDFVDNTTCNVEMNSVLIDIKNYKELQSTYFTRFYFKDIVIPEQGIIKFSQYTGEFENYDYWTDKFGIAYIVKNKYIYEDSLELNGQSYSNINAAFTGFNKIDYKSIIINEGKDIIIKPGTFSPYILITVEGDLAAAKLTITPSSSTQDTLEFDANTYSLDLKFPQDKFRVGINQKSSENFYIISWKIAEKSIIPGLKCYKTKQNTKIQVFLGEPYKLTPKSNLFVPVNHTSLPFFITLPEVSPYSHIYIFFTPTIINNLTVTFSPNPAILFKNTFSAYFTISCEKCVYGSKYDFKYRLSSNSKNAFYIKPNGSFLIDRFFTEPAVGFITLNIINQVTASVEISTNDDAVVYWALISMTLYKKDPSFSSIEMIEKKAKGLIFNNGDTRMSLEDQISEYVNKIRNADDQNISWQEYLQKIFFIAENTYFANIEYVSSNESPKVLYTFENLISRTEYIVVAYIKNLSDKEPTKIISSGITPNMKKHAEIEISFSSSSSIDIDKLNEVISLSYKIDKRRIQSSKKTTRNLYSLIYKFNILSSPLSIVPPATIMNNNKNTLSNNLISYDFRVLEIYDIKELNSRNFNVPDIKDIEMINNGNDYIQMNFTLNIDGTICCEFELNLDTVKKITINDVIIGFRSDGESNYDRHLCKNVIARENYVFDHKFKNEEDGNYVFSCAICNSYPILPKCANELVFYDFDWKSGNENCGITFVVMKFVVILGFIV